VRRIALFVMVALVVWSAPVLWAGAWRAGRDVGNVTGSLPVLIAASAFYMSTRVVSAPSVHQPAHVIPLSVSQLSSHRVTHMWANRLTGAS
jgi:hypothetical protein